MQSIVVTKEEHRLFTNQWRKEIPYGTKDLTRDQIMEVAKEIYKDYPEILKALNIE